MTLERTAQGMQKAKGHGQGIGRPPIADKVDIDLVVRLRGEGRSWREIADAHPAVKSASGREVKPSTGSIRRAFAVCNLSQTAKLQCNPYLEDGLGSST